MNLVRRLDPASRSMARRGLMAITFAAAVATSLSQFTTAQPSPRYAIIQIDPVAGGFTQAHGINESGVFTGTTHVDLSGFRHEAYRWDNGTITTLGALPGGCCSIGFGLNDLDHVVGRSATHLFGENHAFLRRDDKVINLGTLGWDKWSQAWAINNQDEVVGGSTYEPDNFANHAFLWQDGVMRDLGVFDGLFSEALDINESGQVVGWSDTLPTWPHQRHAFLWQNEVMTDLGTLGGWESKAYAINDLGVIAGYADTADERHAVLWRDGSIIDLHDRFGPDDEASRCIALNNLGVIIGEFWEYRFGESYPVIWDSESSDSRRLLDDLPPRHGWDIWFVTDLNDAGQIVGEGDNRYGQHRGFILTPVEHEFELAPPTPGVAGQVNEIIASGLEPGERVYFVYSQRGGGTTLPMCELLDATLQLDHPQIIASVIADASGDATLSAFVPDAASTMGDLLIQAVVPSSCKVSELRVVRFR